MRTALIVDVNNLYHWGHRKFPGKVINYPKLTAHIADRGDALFTKTAYGRQAEDKVPEFAGLMRGLGYDLSFGGRPYNVEIALQVAEMISRGWLEHLILGSTLVESWAILKYARNNGVYTTCLGFDPPANFKKVAEVFDIPDEFLMERPNEVPVSSSS